MVSSAPRICLKRMDIVLFLKYGEKYLPQLRKIRIYGENISASNYII